MTDPQEDALFNALSQADANGDTKAAAGFAARIKALRASKGAAPGGTDSLGGGDNSNIAHQIYAGIHNFEDTVTFGLGDRAAALGASMINPDLSYEQAYNNIKQTSANASEGNPITALAGDVAGLVTGGGAIAGGARILSGVKGAGALTRGLNVVGNVASRAFEGGTDAGRVARIARQAAVGGGFGFASAVGHGESADNTLLSTAEGAIAGPILATAGTAVARRAMGVTSKAMALLAEKIKEPPEVLQRFFDNFAQSVGRPPRLAEIVDAKSRGELKQVAAGNTTVGDAVNTAADESAAMMPGVLGKKIAQLGGQPENINDLLTARKENMTDAMKPINDKPVTVNTNDADLLSDPRVRASFANGSPLRAKLAEIVGNLTQPGQANSDLSVREIDQIRQAIRGKQAAFSNPANTLHNPHTAREYGDLAKAITDLGTRQYPEYATNLENFAADSDYIHGFKHGLAGKGLGEAERPEVIDALGRRTGQLGFRSGVVSRLHGKATESDTGAVGVARDLTQGGGTIKAVTEAAGGQTAADLAATGGDLTRANESINAIAPRTLTPQDESLDISHVAHGVAAATYHSPTAIGYHLSRVFGGKLRMSPAVARTVAKYLSDPKMTQQAINLLKKAGASNADILKLATSISASTGINAGRANDNGQ